MSYINEEKILEEVNRLKPAGVFSEAIKTAVIKIIEKQPDADVVELKPFIENAQFAIKATDSADSYSSGFRNGIRYCLALIEGKEPEYEALKGVKPVEKFPFYNCPSCNEVVSEHNKFCSECGQALDWSNTE